MNEIDSKLLTYLMAEGRATWADLAGRLGLSAPAVADRVRRLEERGVIRGYAARVDPEAVGCALTAFVTVLLERPEHRDGFLARVASLAEVQECHHLAGEYDYLLKVRCGGTRDLERLVSEELKGVPGVARTVTMIALSTAKETATVPLGRETSPES